MSWATKKGMTGELPPCSLVELRGVGHLGIFRLVKSLSVSDFVESGQSRLCQELQIS